MYFGTRRRRHDARALARGGRPGAARARPDRRRFADRRSVRGRDVVQRTDLGAISARFTGTRPRSASCAGSRSWWRGRRAGRRSASRARRWTRRPAAGDAGRAGSRRPATATDLRQPFQWPPGPGAYVALGYGSDRFTLAFATYMPYLEKITFPTSPTGNEPTRYQVLSMDLRNLALVPALAIRFGNDFRVGLSSGFLFSTGSLSFAEDTALEAAGDARAACGAENPRPPPATTSTRARGSATRSSRSRSAAASTGATGTWSWGSRTRAGRIGGQVAGVEVAADNTTVTLPPRLGGGPSPAPGDSRTAACSATSPIGCPTSSSGASPGTCDQGWSSTSWRAGSGPTCTTGSTCAWSARRWRPAGLPRAHRPLPRVSRHRRHPGPHRLLVARAAAHRRRAARRERRRRRQRGERRSRRRLSARAGHPGRAAPQSEILARRRLRNYHHAQRDRHQFHLRPDGGHRLRGRQRQSRRTPTCLPGALNGTARPTANGTYTNLTQDFGLTFTVPALRTTDAEPGTDGGDLGAGAARLRAASTRRGAAAVGSGGGGRRGRTDRDRARADGRADGEQVAARQRARDRAAPRSARDRGQLHDLVPRRLAQRGRGRPARRAWPTCSST